MVAAALAAGVLRQLALSEAAALEDTLAPQELGVPVPAGQVWGLQMLPVVLAEALLQAVHLLALPPVCPGQLDLG